MANGSATITASVGSVSATCSVSVVVATVTSISAVLNASGHTFYVGDPVDDIKPYLTVTATYSDSSTQTVPSGSYTLSGTLSQVGANTITVSYESVTTTVSVTCAAVELSYISAVYTQSGTVYDNDTLDSLKSDLVVTAHYSDSTTSTVASADYTLSGTLTVGTSSVTVTYEGKTTTFSVAVTHNDVLYSLPQQTSFTPSTSIDTGIKFETGNVYTVFVDYSPTAYPTQGSTGATYDVFGNRQTLSSGYAQISTQKNSSGANVGTYHWGMGVSWANGKNILSQDDRIRAVIIVDAVNFDYEQHFKNVTQSTSNTYTNTSSEAAICRNANVYLGCAEGSSSTGFTGTMYDFKIFDYELTSAEITALLNG